MHAFRLVDAQCGLSHVYQIEIFNTIQLNLLTHFKSLSTAAQILTKLIIVDEPTAGLDPVERNRFYNILSELSENTVVILSTEINLFAL